MDDLVLELLEHKITLVDAPFAEVMYRSRVLPYETPTDREAEQLISDLNMCISGGSNP
jgi:hypothetical protein